MTGRRRGGRCTNLLYLVLRCYRLLGYRAALITVGCHFDVLMPVGDTESPFQPTQCTLSSHDPALSSHPSTRAKTTPQQNCMLPINETCLCGKHNVYNVRSMWKNCIAYPEH